MIIGICTIRFEITDSTSLKNKRQVCQSLIAKVKRNYNVSVAEIDDLNSYRFASLAFVSVNTNKSKLNSTLSKIVELLEKNRDIVIEKYNIELL